MPAQEQRGTSHGTLIIIGGGARESSLQAVADHIIPPKYLSVVTLASRDPEYQFNKCRDGLAEFGFEFSHLSKDSLKEESESYIPSHVTGVFMTGGRQDDLMEALGTSRFSQELREYYNNGGTIIGTSAGASFMGDKMPLGQSHADGFGLVPHIIDQHFTQHNRKGRLISLIQQFPDKIGIGIDENTAVIYNNSHMMVMGEGQVFVLQTNEYNEIDENVLTHGQEYTITEK
jgi:cyanophycinase